MEKRLRKILKLEPGRIEIVMNSISRRDFFKMSAGGILLPFILESVEVIELTPLLPNHVIAGLTDVNISMYNLTLAAKAATREIDNFSSMISDLYMEPLNTTRNKRKNLICRIYTSNWMRKPQVIKQVFVPYEQLRFRIHTHKLSGETYEVETRLTAIPIR